MAKPDVDISQDLIMRLEADQKMLNEIMDFVMKHEPCGYYCDEAVGHIDHKYFNWLKGILGDIQDCKEILTKFKVQDLP